MKTPKKAIGMTAAYANRAIEIASRIEIAFDIAFDIEIAFGIDIAFNSLPQPPELNCQAF